MNADNWDKIRINDLSLRCVIGTREYEREDPQEVLVNITLYGDFSRAAETDSIRHTIDYSGLKTKISRLVEESTFKLLEALAEEIADEALRQSMIEKVLVSVQKPAALRFTRSAEVEIMRSR